MACHGQVDRIVGCGKLLIAIRLKQKLQFCFKMTLYCRRNIGMNFRIMFGFLNRWLWPENQNAAQQTLKDVSFSPLYICYAAFISHFNLRVVAGKITDALLENFKVTQTFCGSEIPPCSPQARRSCKELVTALGLTLNINCRFSNWRLQFDSPSDFSYRLRSPFTRIAKQGLCHGKA